MNSINVKVEDKELWPTRAHTTDAGMDLKASKINIIKARETAKVGTGTRMEIPAGFVGFLMPRSGNPYNLANTIGVIDSDYRGEIIAKITNDSKESITIGKYEKFVQLVIVPCITPTPVLVTKLSPSGRGTKGFGSTGK